MNHPLIRKRKPEATIHSVDEFVMMSMSVEVLIVDHTSCNNKSLTAVDLSSFSNLKVFEVGDSSFAFVEEMKLIGLNQLERVVIGKWCCRRSSKDRCFCVENCEKLRELKMGRYSFSDYPVCNFEYKGAKGRNRDDFRREIARLRNHNGAPSECLLPFRFGFNGCSHVVLESESIRERLMNRPACIDFGSIWPWCFLFRA